MDAWTIPIGGLQGIPIPRQDQKRPTTYYLFNSDTPEFELQAPKKHAIGVATITKVDPTHSELQLPKDLEGDTSAVYLAVLKQLSKTLLRLWIEGDEKSVEALKKTLSGSKYGYISLAETKTEANYSVIANNGSYIITRPYDGRPLVMKTKSLNTTKTANDLEHISRWVKASETYNPDTSFANFPFKVEAFEVTQQDKEGTPVPLDQLNFSSKYVHGSWEPRKFRISFTNTTEEPLFASILFLSSRYGVQPMAVEMFKKEDLHGNVTRRFEYVRKIEPGERFEVMNRMPLKANLDNCLLYTSDAADDMQCVDLGGRRIIKKKQN